MARAMKDSGIEWIGEMPINWSIGRIKYNYYLKGRIGWQGLKADEFIDDGPYLVTGTDFRNGRVNWTTCYHISQERYDEAPEIHVKTGDLLITKDGTIGKVAFIEEKPEQVSLNSHLLIMRPLSLCYSNRFLYWVIQSPAFVKYSLWSQNGTVMASLSQERINDFSYAMPSKQEQDRIASFLDTECARIDAVIEKTRASIEEYRKLKQSVITQAVTKGIRPGRKMKDSGIEWIGEIPEDWKVLSLGAVTESMRNGYVGPTKDLFVDEGIKYIQSLHIKDGRINFSRQQYYVSEEWANVHPKIREKDVLIVQTGDIGSVGLVTAEYDGCNCHALIIATPKTDLVFPQYLTFFLRSAVGKELLLYYKTGALLPHLNSGKIKFASICVPSLQEQKEIADYLNRKCAEIDTLFSKKESFAAELESYKKSLIFEYVTGKKEVAAC